MTVASLGIILFDPVSALRRHRGLLAPGEAAIENIPAAATDTQNVETLDGVIQNPGHPGELPGLCPRTAVGEYRCRQRQPAIDAAY
ncbi:hypothetical protein [Sphingobium sp. CAP-1]|uniref:hypothetical protein n=1 Tax=Sphingobium sp. CAP-1 TaxID=2676077 RepID=UPI0012BB4326|nr:hypothetical protein [Sphingobium sp. CAP-1]QGP80454.1 hypothetical protein GL174_15060 [Sphingobium sp. CAP-1]